ncbi:hypothetical protein QTN25_006876 [Entamoeba marina]
MVIVVAYGKNKQFIHEVVNQLFELYESDNIDVKIEILENFGVLSEVEEFKQYIPRLNELLLHIVQQQDNERLFEMAICTYGKCIINHSSYFQSNVVMDWIYTLPIGCHNDEVLWCLFVVIQKNMVLLTDGVIKKILLIIFNVFDACDTSFISSKTRNLIVEMINNWLLSSDQCINETLNGLNEEEKNLLIELTHQNR